MADNPGIGALKMRGDVLRIAGWTESARLLPEKLHSRQPLEMRVRSNQQGLMKAGGGIDNGICKRKGIFCGEISSGKGYCC